MEAVLLELLGLILPHYFILCCMIVTTYSSTVTIWAIAKNFLGIDYEVLVIKESLNGLLL